MEKVTFYDDLEGVSVDFYVLEETTLNGQKYLLVTEEETEDSEAYIMREMQSETEDATYEMVEDDLELQALGKIFAELLDDDTKMEF